MKPEARFIKNVHDVLHADVYREKMFNPLRGGTPDVYYVGFVDDLWVEYKWAKKIGPKPGLTPLQLAWLSRAWDRGREPWVVIGSPAGCVVLRQPDFWMTRASDQPLLSKHELARSIEGRCGLEHLVAPPSPRGISTR